MIRAAIFDVDGTILDSMPVWFNSGENYLRSLGLTPEEGLSNLLFTMSLNDSVNYIKEHYKLSKPFDEVLHGITDVIKEQYRDSIPLKKGAGEILQALYEADIPMCIATAGDRSYLLPAFRRLDIMRFFKKIYTCVELETNKKEPLIYLTAASEFGFAPEEIVVFEDAYMAAKAARNGGFKVVGLFDISSADKQDELKANCDIYAKDLSCVKIDDIFNL